MSNPAVNTIIATMFSQVTSSLTDLITSDLAVVTLAILSIFLIIIGFGIIRDFLSLGLSEKERNLKSSYLDLQRHKGTWREDVYKKKYQEALNNMEEQPRKYF